MISYSELKQGIYIALDGAPYLVMSSEFVRMQQRKPVMKATLKNLITGRTQEKSFQMSDEIEEAEIEKIGAKFLYHHRDEFWFCESGNPKNRFMLSLGILGEGNKFLKPNLDIKAMKFGEKIIGIELPIKVDYKVIEAPPAIKGDTAQGGTKTVVIESGAKISVPLFINEGDIIRVNTQTGEYTERTEKV